MRPASAFPPKRVGPPVRMEKKRAQIGTVERWICASDGLIRLSALNCEEKSKTKNLSEVQRSVVKIQFADSRFVI